MADPIGASMRVMIVLVLILAGVFGTIYGTLIGVGKRDDHHPGWVSAGWVGLCFTGLLISSIVLWIMSDLWCDHCLGKMFNSGKALLAFLLTLSTVLLAGTGISIWLTVKGRDEDRTGLLGGAICALVHFVILDLIIVSITVLMTVGFINNAHSNPGSDQ